MPQLRPPARTRQIVGLCDPPRATQTKRAVYFYHLARDYVDGTRLADAHTQPRNLGRTICQPGDRFSPGNRPFRVHQDSVDPISDEFRDAAQPRTEHWCSRGKGFEYDQWASLKAARRDGNYVARLHRLVYRPGRQRGPED